MNKLPMKKYFILIFILSISIGTGNAQLFNKNPEKKLFGKTLGHKKEAKVKEPRSVQKARKKQEANDKKLKSDYNKSVIQSRERTLDMQTPEVQERMKKNQKDSEIRDKAKKKKVKTSSKKAGKKYR